MKKFGFLGICLGILFLCLPQGVVAQTLPDPASMVSTPLTIQEALDTAWSNNPDLRKAQLEVEKSEISRDKVFEAVTWIPTGGLVVPAYQQVFNNYQQAEIGLSVAKKTEKLEKDRIAKDVIAAYTLALNNFNRMELAYETYQDMQERAKNNSIANSIGLSSDYDYEQFSVVMKQAEQGYRAAQVAYESSIAELRQILGRSSEWNPRLTSQANLSTYQRESLSLELTRAMSESVLVWSKEALLDIEKSKQNWVLPNLPGNMQQINLDMAEIDYEQAKRSARVTIEGLYNTIDLLEKQIAVAELNLQSTEKDLSIAELRYELGVISKNGLIPGGQDLASVQLKAHNAKVELQSLKSQLAQAKAEYAYLTGKEVFNIQDWNL